MTTAKPEPADTPEAKPRAKRRWFQFSLRSMFMWVTVIGVLLTVGLRWLAPAQRQRAVVQMVERLGGSVQYAYPSVNEGWLTTWLRDWLPRDSSDTLSLVNLNRSSVADADLRSLASLTQLQGLWLDSTQVTDAGLAHLNGLTQLRWLTINDTQITDAGLTNLSGLNQLQVLSLYRTQITDDGLAQLRKALPKCAIE